MYPEEISCLYILWNVYSIQRTKITVKGPESEFNEFQLRLKSF